MTQMNITSTLAIAFVVLAAIATKTYAYSSAISNSFLEIHKGKTLRH
jgi:hypothetical protein